MGVLVTKRVREDDCAEDVCCLTKMNVFSLPSASPDKDGRDICIGRYPLIKLLIVLID